MSQQRLRPDFLEFSAEFNRLVTAEVLRRRAASLSFLLRTVRDFRKSFRGRFIQTGPEEQLQWMEQLRMRLLDMAGNEPLAGYFTEIRDRGLDFRKGMQKQGLYTQQQRCFSATPGDSLRWQFIKTVKRSARTVRKTTHCSATHPVFERVSASGFHRRCARCRLAYNGNLGRQRTAQTGSGWS